MNDDDDSIDIRINGQRQCSVPSQFCNHDHIDVMSPILVAEQRKLLKNIIGSYESPIVRAYSRVRFLIVRQSFLNEVAQYLPNKGTVLDVGCGFGLFGLYFAGSFPNLQFVGCDINDQRITLAKIATDKLGINNIKFLHVNALSLTLDSKYDGIYTLDLIHHLPRTCVAEFLQRLYESLNSPGVLIIKDVDSRPVYKRWFTLALDRMMVGLREPIHYWPVEELTQLLWRIGFRVYIHRMVDILPYPHMMYICYK